MAEAIVLRATLCAGRASASARGSFDLALNDERGQSVSGNCPAELTMPSKRNNLADLFRL